MLVFLKKTFSSNGPAFLYNKTFPANSLKCYVLNWEISITDFPEKLVLTRVHPGTTPEHCWFTVCICEWDRLSTSFLPGSQHQTAVHWDHVTPAPHWGQSKSRTLLQTDHSGLLGHSWIPFFDCLKHPEGHIHLQIQAAGWRRSLDRGILDFLKVAR